MGLDMYLLSAPKIDGMNLEQVLLANGRFHQLEEGDERYKLVKPYIKHFEEFGHKWSSMLEEVAYWRKANQIHNWFVENLNDGTDEPVFTVEVTKDQLKELYKLCIETLTKHTHHMIDYRQGQVVFSAALPMMITITKNLTERNRY
ncbi:hypothetical protein IEC97_17610 [Neobacillus cucumis]|uniref:hypothetical protein n=1 Tax=Neobacillus cucumis TaxID=1740721 RepID=UPI0018DF8FD1|nr:hypothetical protein [Neobacillus cucumis]MBI0579191.1 hypothetical protein [Neobacillus cucumis]